jgi:hypothetical protein
MENLMPTIIQQISYIIFYPIILAIFLFLSSCAPNKPITVVKTEQRIEYVVPDRSPVKLSNVQFKVIELDGKLYVVLDMDNYAKLSKNMETLQSRLNSDNQIIKNLETFHKKKK